MAFGKHNMSLLRQQPNNKTVHKIYYSILEIKVYIAFNFCYMVEGADLWPKILGCILSQSH